MVLPARNLALAQKAEVKADFLVPCSACYLNLRKVEEQVRQDGELLARINEVLEEEDLRYRGGIHSRHLLDVLANDIGADRVLGSRTLSLEGLRVVPYYGCQALRPYQTYDDPEFPKSMEPLIEALGAEVVPWNLGAKCCGAGLMTTKKEAAQEAVAQILAGARGGDCIVTICPMCQMNLEGFQKKISKIFGEDLRISVLYLPQLIGLALGLSDRELKLDKNLALHSELWDRLRSLKRGSP